MTSFRQHFEEQETPLPINGKQQVHEEIDEELSRETNEMIRIVEEERARRSNQRESDPDGVMGFLTEDDE